MKPDAFSLVASLIGVYPRSSVAKQILLPDHQVVDNVYHCCYNLSIAQTNIFVQNHANP